MSRRSALIAAFLALSALTNPFTALAVTGIVLAPIAAAEIAHAYTGAHR